MSPNFQNISDHTLLFRYSRRGNMDAFEELMDRHQSALLGLASALLLDRQHAQEVVQDVFMRCADMAEALIQQAEQRSKADPIAVEYTSLRTWLCRVTRNASIDRIRTKKKEHMQLSNEMLEQIDGSSAVADSLSQDEMKNVLWQAVENLPLLERAAVCLRYRQQLSYKEISQQLGKTVNHVGLILHQAHEHLREHAGLRAEIIS